MIRALFLAVLFCFPVLVLADGPLIRTPVVVQDFAQPSSLPKVAVVNIPDQNASVALSTDHAFEGKQGLKLHYHFTGNGQYLVIPMAIKIDAPIHKIHFMLYGDGSGSGYGLYITDASGETH